MLFMSNDETNIKDIYKDSKKQWMFKEGSDFVSELGQVPYSSVICSTDLLGLYPKKLFLDILYHYHDSHIEELIICLWVYFEISKPSNETVELSVESYDTTKESNRRHSSGELVDFFRDGVVINPQSNITEIIKFENIINASVLGKHVRHDINRTLKKYHKYFFTVQGFMKFFINTILNNDSPLNLRFISRRTSGRIRNCKLEEDGISFTNLKLTDVEGGRCGPMGILLNDLIALTDEDLETEQTTENTDFEYFFHLSRYADSRDSSEITNRYGKLPKKGD